MGTLEVHSEGGSERLRAFTRAVLQDLRALERMLAEGRLERGIRRIGAEQELFLVDAAGRPASLGPELLERLPANAGYTGELGRFNLEFNLDPFELSGDCLSRLERDMRRRLEVVRGAAAELGARPVLCGILPTLERAHLSLEHMSPGPRYAELNRVLCEMRGREFETAIKGVDELRLVHDNVMLEACNTSFQIHFQIDPESFPAAYNLAQVVTAPVLAAAVNSPLLLGRRLWHETRVALFEQSLDVRSAAHQARGSRTRVHFGERWVDQSVLELFREDLARFRVVLSSEPGEDPLEMLERGENPPLSSLCLFNGTVYRWNRPCFGLSKGVAHLRIENRVLPAGPTLADEVAGAAFYFGLMTALDRELGDVRTRFRFDHVRANFTAAARSGLKAGFHWADGRPVSAVDLVLELVPRAREGLLAQGVGAGDVDHYLGLLEERVRARRTGSQWVFDSLRELDGLPSADARHRALVSAMVDLQAGEAPVARWPLAGAEHSGDWRESFRTVRQVMSSDLFTLHPEDVVDLAASLMEWEHVRHVPVEDHAGKLVGLVSARQLLRLVGRSLRGAEAVPVREIMRSDPVTINAGASTLEAIETMRLHRVSCLPVVEDGRLVGIVTERDFVQMAGRLLEEALRGPATPEPAADPVG